MRNSVAGAMFAVSSHALRTLPRPRLASVANARKFYGLLVAKGANDGFDFMARFVRTSRGFNRRRIPRDDRARFGLVAARLWLRHWTARDLGGGTKRRDGNGNVHRVSPIGVSSVRRFRRMRKNDQLRGGFCGSNWLQLTMSGHTGSPSSRQTIISAPASSLRTLPARQTVQWVVT